MSSYKSYPKVYNLGHSAIKDLFHDEVVIQEKLDGSQFSFGVDEEGNFRCRSKGKEQWPGPDKMFEAAVGSVMYGRELQPGWTYSGEYIRQPKHNMLTYGRTPRGFIALFDIRSGEEDYLTPSEVQQEAERLDLECVPTFDIRQINCVEDVEELMEKESFLGGTKIEGLVFKNYKRFTRDGKAMMGKYVSEQFKELNNKDFRLRNPSGGDMIGQLGDMVRTEARWNKAIQRFRDEGKLTGEPKDIGPLMKAIQEDIKEECEEEIKEKLWKWAWDKIRRRSSAGFAEYYKRLLAEEQFSDDSSS